MNPMPLRPTRLRPRPQRRGVAMVLVMVALGTATTLTATYVAARDSTPAIGANAAASTATEYAAKSAANAAVAILQTQANWSGDADPTSLLKDFSLAGAKVSVLVTNLEGKPPAAGDNDLLITATAIAGNTRRVMQRIVRYQPSEKPVGAIDPYLGEYAVYASKSIKVQTAATIAPWTLSPALKSNKKVKLGAGFTSSGDLTIDSDVKLIDTALIVNNSAWGPLKARINDAQFVVGDVLPVNVPAAPPALPSALTGLVTRATSNQVMSSPMSATLASGRYQNVDIKDWFTATLDAANGANYSFNDLTLDNRGVLRIKGAVRIHVREDLVVKTYASLELADATSSAEIYVARHLDVDNAGVGVPRAVAQNASRAPGDVSTYSAPGRIRITSLTALSGGDTYSVNINLKNKAVVNAAIHFPYADITMDSNAALIGRITADEVTLKGGASLLYDPALDNNAGFSTRAGPLYAADRSPVGGLTTGLLTFNAATGVDALPGVVQSAVDLVGIIVIPPPSPGATPRAAERATGADWPALALSLEKSAPASDTSGAIVLNEIDTRLLAEKQALITATKTSTSVGVVEIN